MRFRTSAGALGALLVLAASSGPGAAAGGSPASLGLAAWPARATVVAGRPQLVHVRNGGLRPLVVDVSVTRLALDLHGTPRVARARGAPQFLAVRPRTFRLPPGATTTITARPAVPRGARPGDHPLLVLLRTRPQGGRAIGVLVRLGVVLDVRVPGHARRRLLARALRVVRRGRRRRLVLVLANRGDLTERRGPGLTLEVFAGRRRVARLRTRRHELLPHSRGVLQLAYTGHRRGPVRVVVISRGLRRKVFHVRL